MELIEYKRPEGAPRTNRSNPIVTINKSKLLIYKTLVVQLKLETGMKFKVLFDKEGTTYVEFLPASNPDTNTYSLYQSSKQTISLKTSIADLVKDEKLKDDSIYNLEVVEMPDRKIYKLVFVGPTQPNKNRKNAGEPE